MWEYIPFENCLEKTKIKFKLPKKDYRESGEYPIVSQEENLISGYHDDISYIFKVAKPIVVFGDHTLALKYIDFDFIVGADGVKILQPVEQINPKYFYYVLKALMPKTTGYARHYKLLKKLDIPVPPLAEQQRIVAKLDAAFAEIDENMRTLKFKQDNVKNLQSSLLRSSLNVEDNTWKTSRLGDVIENGETTNPTINPNTLFSYIDISSIDRSSFRIMQTHTLLGKDAPSRARRLVRKGDVLFATTRPTLQRIAIISDDLDKEVCSTGFIVLNL